MSNISVIVPVYNSEKYIEKCINSILSQTYKDFELILIDDGSTDKSEDICDDFSKIDNRIRVIHQKNQGQAAARNLAILNSVGEWICFVDSDDIIHPQMLEILYEATKEDNVKMSICKAIEAEVIPQDFYEKVECSYTLRKINESFLKELMDCGEHSYWVAFGKLIHREIVNHIPFQEGKIYEDNEVVCKWIYYSNVVSLCEHRMYFYYVNKEGTTKSKYSLKHLDWLWALEEQIKFYLKIGYSIMVKSLSSRYVIEIAQIYNRVLTELNNKPIARKIRTKMVVFILKNKENIELSYKNWKYIIGLMSPKMIYLLGRIKHVLYLRFGDIDEK